MKGHSASVVDAAAAGDTFSGSLDTALARGGEVVGAARFANAAAALSVTRAGAIASVPDPAELETFPEVQPVPD